jgi:putative transposase
MAKRQFTLTEQAVQEFRQVEQTTSDPRELKRLQAVRLYGTGYPVDMIVEMIGCSWRALMDWCQSYQHQGISGLQSHWQGNNALKLSRQQRTDLKEKLHTYRPDQVLPPHMRVHQGQFWTVSDLRIVVQQWYGVVYRSDRSYHGLLHESRFSQQRTESQYRSRPDDRQIAEFEAELEKK